MCSLTYWITVKLQKSSDLFAYIKKKQYLCSGFGIKTVGFTTKVIIQTGNMVIL